MKYLATCFIALVIVSCNSKEKKAPRMPGSYFMISQTVNTGTQSTKNTDLKQLKIYTDKYFMYTQVNPADSVSGFGIGTYTSDTSGVTENSIYTSRDTTYDTTRPSYKLNIVTTSSGYNQFIPNIMIDGDSAKLTEEYQKVGTNTKSPLDGIWKMTEAYYAKGSDTTRFHRLQYKAFYSGYFMWGHTLKDSTGIHTGIGFGTFKMDGNNKLTETDLNSTYAINTGQTFTIDIELNGTDSFKQIINQSDGLKNVEVYERVK